MLIYGFGGHARVVWTALHASGGEAVGFVDDGQPPGSWNGVEVLGPYRDDIHPEAPVVLAIGDNGIRRRLAEVVAHRFGAVRHPSAIVDASCVLAEGSMVLHGSIVQVGASVGAHTIVNTGASIDHDCEVGEFVHIGPGSTLCGDVSVGSGSLVGAGAVVLPGISIGSGVTVGAGTVVHRDVDDGATIVGNPGIVLSDRHA